MRSFKSFRSRLLKKTQRTSLNRLRFRKRFTRFYSETPKSQPNTQLPPSGFEDYEDFLREKSFAPEETPVNMDTRYYTARKRLDVLGIEDTSTLDNNYKKLSSEQKLALEDILKARQKVIEDFKNSHKNIDFEPIFSRINYVAESSYAKLNTPVRVAVTGASGQIGYALIFRIACGAMFGPNTPVILHLLELPGALKALQGVVMELQDCAFPLLKGVVATDDPDKAFEGVDYALLVGAKPRGPGMERKDLLKENALIFKQQGTSLNRVGKGDQTRVAVVGNPANTNAFITAHFAPNIPGKNITAMTRLDYNRGLTLLSTHLKTDLRDIKRFIIWGNHSSTQFPDISHATLGDKLLTDLIDQKWLVNTFIPTVQKRGLEVIKAKEGKSSAASAASALIDHVRDWHLGSFGKWTSVAVRSEGEYGVTKGLYYSYPVIHNPQSFEVVKDLPIDEFAAERMEQTHKELLEERDVVSTIL